MTYDETLDYLFHSLPAYHRIGAAAYKADLNNTLSLMEHLGHPEQGFSAIHVAGTNGKGSVSHFLASTLHRTGLKVGLYTSPHLVDFRERIRIDGQMIPCETVVDFVEQHRSFFQKQQLSFFEMTVGLAFYWFAAQKVDVAVVEVGMGGRLDSTNVVNPILSIITNIGFDHTQFLGDTLPKIAVEKAGIIKRNVPVVVGETHPETQPVFVEKAQAMNAPILFADSRYRVVEKNEEPSCMYADVYRDGQLYVSDIQSPLGGLYQHKNIATLCAAFDKLNELGVGITMDQLREGIANVIKDTGLHGRWECLGENPLLICETAHNADGIASLVQKLKMMHYTKLHLIYGCVGDKDYPAILAMLPRDASYYFTRPSVERGLDQHTLAAAASEIGLQGPEFSNVVEALAEARRNAAPSDLIVVTGSIFLVADLLSVTGIKDC